MPIRAHPHRPSIVWNPPLLGNIKINVNGSCSAGSTSGCIGRVFLDQDSRILLHFGKQVTVDLAIQTEVLVIREGIFIVAASQWSNLATFLIISNSLDAVHWSLTRLRSWRFYSIIWEGIHKFGRNISWSLIHIRRTGNKIVDILARLGASGSCFIEFA